MRRRVTAASLAGPGRLWEQHNVQVWLLRTASAQRRRDVFEGQWQAGAAST